ncbi:MAG: ABC transporter permease [Dysgonomonas sp.]
MKLIWKLLKENISKPQLAGFFFANLIGMTILLLSFQFYFDINPIFSQKDNLFKKDYFIITKKLGLLSSLTSAKSTFNKDEIAEISQTGFVKDIGAFIPSQFSVRAGISSSNAGMGFNTDMFFESVPVQFIDVNTEEWKFSPSDNSVPIILPKNYLDLYNFGFAESKSMPKLTENLIKMINFDITIQGNGQMKQLKGKVVGLSTRINTILVPEPFMQWANESYGNHANAEPSRLIVEVKDVTDPQINTFFKDRGYDLDQGNTAASRISIFLKIIVSIVAVVGLIICLLSFFILVLSIYLLLEKNMQKLINLRLLGYAKNVVIKPYILLSLGINLATFLLSLILVMVIEFQYSKVVERVFSNYESTGFLYTGLIGLAIFLLLGFLNVFIIRRKVK